MWYLWICATLMLLWIMSEKWKAHFFAKYWDKSPAHSPVQIVFFSLLYGRIYTKQLTLRESQQALIWFCFLVVIVRHGLAVLFFPFGMVAFAAQIQQRDAIAKCFNSHNLGRGQTCDELDSSQKLATNHAKIKRVRMYCPTLDACNGGTLPETAHHCVEWCPVFNISLPQLIFFEEDEQEYNDSVSQGESFVDLNDYEL